MGWNQLDRDWRFNYRKTNNGCFGTTTAGIYAGGGPGGSPYNDNQVMTWNGSSWTEVAEVNTGRYASTGSGSSTAGMISGGKILRLQTQNNGMVRHGQRVQI